MTTRKPHARVWTEYRPHGEGDPVTGPAGTYRVEADRVLAWIAPGTFTTIEQLQDLANQVHQTRLCQVTLIGPHAETRRVQQALQDLWATQKPAPPPRATPEPKPQALRPRCGQPRANGRPCGQPAGWGADDPDGPCRLHGGSTTKREQQMEQAVDAAMRYVELLTKASTQPLTLQDKVDGIDAVKTLRAARRAGRLR